MAAVRGAALLLLLAGCEAFEFGPELQEMLVERDEDPDCELTEMEMMDGIKDPPCVVLRVAPFRIPVEEDTLVEVAFHFQDPDADVSSAHLEIRTPSGETRELECLVPAEGESLPCVATLLSDFSVRTFEGQFGATVGLTFFYTPTELGNHRVTVYMEDAEGFESNRLANDLEVAAPGQTE